jgi:O-antigen ligase
MAPFANLGAADSLDLGSDNFVVSYIVFAFLAGACLVLTHGAAGAALKRLANPAYLCLAGWLLASALTSQDPVTSLKRAALTGFVACIAATSPLLPRGTRRLAILLAIAAALLLGLSYFGVVFIPQYAVHQATDIGEPGLAGDWRGVFGHKNVAVAVFVCTGFMGIYVARTGFAVAGAAISVLSLIFVYFCHGKTAGMLWLPTLVISAFVSRYGAGWGWRVAALAPFVLLTTLGVGSVISAPIASLVAGLPIDPTFTGRSDIWRFALDKLPSHPFLGFGFDAFWDTGAVRYAGEGPTAWVAGAAHAHNCLVDIALTMGVPGVALTLWAFVLQPLADIRAAVMTGANPALVALLTQIWLFGVYVSTLESFMFDRSNPIWFTFLFAVFALRYASRFRTSAT